jgi:hypothetical protein
MGYFLDRLDLAKPQYPVNCIFNFDETCWKRSLGPTKVLGDKGSEAVKLKIVKGKKEAYTGYGCISAVGEK